jgi:hypothetical protein
MPALNSKLATLTASRPNVKAAISFLSIHYPPVKRLLCVLVFINQPEKTIKPAKLKGRN